MRVAGLGFRRAAGTASLRAALDAALGAAPDATLDTAGATGLDALATAAEKADAPALRALAADLGLPIHAVAREDLAAQPTPTRSDRVRAQWATGSLAEAAALAAAGPGARLIAPRSVSPDGMATAAIAETDT